MGKEDLRHRAGKNSRDILRNLQARVDSLREQKRREEGVVGGFSREDYQAGRDTELSTFPQSGVIYVDTRSITQIWEEGPDEDREHLRAEADYGDTTDQLQTEHSN